MAFNGDEGSVVTLAEASGWTANYRRTVPAGGSFRSLSDEISLWKS